jgi:hypothetical protein
LSGGYRYGFNGQEKSDEIFEGSTTALFWQYDSRLGRRWNLDPKPTIGISDYAVNGNNPIIFIDPLGDFKTKFGAKVYKFFHGGEVKHQENGAHKGEWYVSKKGESSVGSDGSVTVSSIAVYNNKISSTAEYIRGGLTAYKDFIGFVHSWNPKTKFYGQDDFETQQLMTSPGMQKGMDKLKTEINNNTYDWREGTQFPYSFSPNIKKVLKDIAHFRNPLNSISQENKDAHVDVFKTQSWQKLYLGGYSGRMWKISSDMVLVEVQNYTTANSFMIHLGEKLFDEDGAKKFNYFWETYTPFFHKNEQVFIFTMPLK